jgi:hypothetical protein
MKEIITQCPLVRALLGICLYVSIAGCDKTNPNPQPLTRQDSAGDGSRRDPKSKPVGTSIGHGEDKIETHSEFEKYVELAKTNLEEALRLISTELPRSRQDKARVALLYACKKGGLENLQRLADSIQDLGLRRRELGSMAFDLADRDPQQLFEFATKSMSNENRNVVMHEAVRGAVRRGEYDRAKAMIDAMPFSKSRVDAIGDVSGAFARKDPDGAFRWAKSLSSDEDRDRAFLTLTDAIADTQGLNGLTAILNSTNNENVQAGCINEAVKIVTRDDNVSAAQLWLESLPPQFQGKALTALIDATANSNFQDWTAAVLSLPERRDREPAIAAIAYRWATSEPKEAAQWALTLPDDVRTAALSSLIGRWYEIDSEQLSSWVRALPPGTNRDTVLEYLAYKVKRTDKPTALDLANQIQDGGVKQRALRSLNLR